MSCIITDRAWGDLWSGHCARADGSSGTIPSTESYWPRPASNRHTSITSRTVGEMPENGATGHTLPSGELESYITWKESQCISYRSSKNKSGSLYACKGRESLSLWMKFFIFSEVLRASFSVICWWNKLIWTCGFTVPINIDTKNSFSLFVQRYH